ncbi:MAG: hypothetical protein ACKVH1_10995, partial [Alphaproteobacteria bacterium]
MDSLERLETSTHNDAYRGLFAGMIAVAVCGALAGALFAAAPYVSVILAFATVALLGGTLWRPKKARQVAPSLPQAADTTSAVSDWNQIAQNRLQGVV